MTSSADDPARSDGTADRPRNAVLAGFLSLLAPGLGQVYNGEARKAIVLTVAAALLTFVGVGLVFSPWFHLAAPFAVLVGSGLWVYAIADAAIGARKRGGAYALKPYNRVLVYVAFLVAVGFARECAILILRERFVQAFRIPSEAMVPTLLVGDFVFADKRPLARVARRGDVIVFASPEDPRHEFMKRVVAVGGDEVEVRDKVVYVNGQAVEEDFVLHVDPATHPASFDPRDNLAPYRVPKFSYFVLGDNRDNSSDSRYWGPVPQALVRGRARGIYWSWDAEKGAPRWDRVGSLVR
jgi:signal peptidase I